MFSFKNNTFLLPFIFCLLVVCIGLLRLKIDCNDWWCTNASLINWDADWYFKVKETGYIFSAISVNNTAFFPLFPYCWRWLHVDEMGMSFINGILFILSCGSLFSFFKTSLKIMVLYLSMSLIVFFTTPMSESLFFLCSTSLLIALEKNNTSLSILSLLGAGLCRSVTTVFFPAFLIICGYNIFIKKNKSDAKKHILFAFVSLFVLMMVFSIHWYQTGEFFAFAKTQKFWGGHWQLPDIPFSSWQPQDNIYVDQFAVFISLLSLLGVCHFVFFRKDNQDISITSLFSLLYLSGTMLLMLFTHGGGFNSMNRYVLSTPYFFFFLKEVEAFNFNKKTVFSIIILGIVYYVVGWHMATSAQRLLVFIESLTGIFMVGILIKKQGRLVNVAIILFVLCALFVQGTFWYRFVTNVWVG